MTDLRVPPHSRAAAFEQKRSLQAAVAGALAAGMLGAASVADARITDIEITSRTIAFGGYAFAGVASPRFAPAGAVAYSVRRGLRAPPARFAGV